MLKEEALWQFCHRDIYNRLFSYVQALNVYFVLAEGFLVFMMQLGFALVSQT